jgi:hypothetical protein
MLFAFENLISDAFIHKRGRNVAILRKRGLLFDWAKMSLQSWTKNTGTKFHRLWDK